MTLPRSVSISNPLFVRIRTAQHTEAGTRLSCKLFVLQHPIDRSPFCLISRHGDSEIAISDSKSSESRRKCDRRLLDSILRRNRLIGPALTSADASDDLGAIQSGTIAGTDQNRF